MMSLFSSFDLSFFFFQISIFSLMIFMLSSYCFKISSLSVVLNFIFQAKLLYFSTLKPKSFTEFCYIFFSIFFLIIVFFNFSSIMPYSFPFCSQVSVVALYSLSIWFSMFMYQIFNNLMGFIQHCIPEGSPIYLTLVLFAIELISSIIRPITLMVRLVANILAGHLLMILLSKLVSTFSPSFIALLGLHTAEVFVGFIQAYIFTTLIVLYFSEV